MEKDGMGGGEVEEEEKRIYTEILTFSFVLLSEAPDRLQAGKRDAPR